jgi:mercuric reductase
VEDEQKKHEIRLRVKGMTCDSCAAHVRRALENVDGVNLVDLPSWESESVRIIARPTVLDKELTDAVKKAGYSAESDSRSEIRQDLILPVTPKTTGYDIVVIGTGGAGVAASIKAAELGYRVALIENGVIGGTCVNVGCVPSKTLIRAAESLHNAKNNPFRGIFCRRTH